MLLDPAFFQIPTAQPPKYKTCQNICSLPRIMWYLTQNIIPDINCMINIKLVIFQKAMSLWCFLLYCSHELPQLLSGFSSPLGQILSHCNLRSSKNLGILQNIFSVVGYLALLWCILIPPSNISTLSSGTHIHIFHLSL